IRNHEQRTHPEEEGRQIPPPPLEGGRALKCDERANESKYEKGPVVGGESREGHRGGKPKEQERGIEACKQCEGRGDHEREAWRRLHVGSEICTRNVQVPGAVNGVRVTS